MAHYRADESYQNKFIPVDFSQQIIPGTYEYALAHIIDNHLDLTSFDKWYTNDKGGATAYLTSTIGEHPELKNLYLNVGHFRNGVVIGLASCQLLVNQIFGQELIVDPRPYLLSEERLVNDTKETDLRLAI